MKLKMIIYVAIFSLLGCSSAKANIEVSIQTHPDSVMGLAAFVIQSTSDEVIIKDVIINRGNCQISPKASADIKKGLKLNFGQRYMSWSTPCTVKDIKEIAITTNKGKFTFSF